MILNHDQLNANHGECLGLLRIILATGDLSVHIMREATRVIEEMEAHDSDAKRELAIVLRNERKEYLEER